MKWITVFDAMRRYKRENRHIPDCRKHKIMFFLTNPEDKSDAIVCFTDTEGEDSYFYNPYKKETARFVMGFDFDEHFFELLDEYNIVKVSFDAHLCFWDYIEESYEYMQELPQNLNKYLLYCKKKYIALLFLKRIIGKNTMRFLKYEDKEVKQ